MKPLWPRILLAVVLAASPSPVWAQAGWFVLPSFGVTEEFDDNIFGERTQERSDFITRSSPGLKAGYRSIPLTLLGGYAFDAEVFAKTPELNDPTARQRAQLEFHYLPTRLLTLDVNAQYTETERPTELLLEETEIELGRRRVTQLQILPSVSYQFDPLTSGDASYFFRQRAASKRRVTKKGAARTTEVTETTQRVQLTLSRQLTPLDTGTLGHRLSLFESEEQAGNVTTQESDATSHTPTIGWTRQLAKETVVTLQGGPRVTDGAVDPEVMARLEHRFKWALVSVDYSRSEATFLNRRGPVSIETLSGSVQFEPLKFLEVRLAPSIRKTSREEELDAKRTTSREEERDTTVYRFRMAVKYRLTKWMSARAEYLFRFQERGPNEIMRNIFSIGLDFDYPVRVD